MKHTLILLLFSAILFSCSNKEKEGILKKPNVLFISIDDLNDWSGFLGNFPNVSTPNIDKLAAQGMAFTNAHCQAPLCAPSRASVFTGLYPHTTGLYYQFNDSDIKKGNNASKNSILMPHYFQQNGYKTLAVGKIFHNGDKESVFQEYGGIFPKMFFGPKPNDKKRLNYNPKWFSNTRGTLTDWGPLKLADSAMSDYKIAEWGVKQLHKKHKKPFFMAIGFVRPHVPWHVPQKWFDMFDEKDIVTPPYLANDLDDIPKISHQLHDMQAMPNTNWLIKENKWKAMIKSYLACMAFVDNQLGKVLNALETSEYKDNTIVVLWSDHGYHLGEKGRTCKHSLWRPSTHVPLIISGPGVKIGSKSNKPVGLIDLYPTLLEMTNLSANNQNEGHSLVSLIKDQQAKWDYVAMTSYGYKNMSLFKGNYHFIQYRDSSGELYDLKKDPNEWVNLFEKPAYKNVVKDFKNHLPDTFAPVSKVNYMNVNKYIDAELLEFGISLKKKKH